MIVRSAVSLPSISRARAISPASASGLYVLERAERFGGSAGRCLYGETRVRRESRGRESSPFIVLLASPPPCRSHIVTYHPWCLDISDFAHVARPCSSTRGSDGPVCQPRLPSRCTPSTSRRRSGSYLFDQLAAAHRSRAAAEGQERDLVPGIADPQRRPEGDQGRCAGCLRRARACLSPSVTVDLVCLVETREKEKIQRCRYNHRTRNKEH